MNLKRSGFETSTGSRWSKQVPKPSYLFHHEDFLTQTADTIIHLRQIKHRKEVETIVEHLGLSRLQQPEEQQFKQQSSKLLMTNEPTRKQWRSIAASVSVETSLRNTRDSTADVSWQRKWSPSSHKKSATREFQPMISPTLWWVVLSICIFLLTPLCLLKTSPSLRSGRASHQTGPSPTLQDATYHHPTQTTPSGRSYGRMKVSAPFICLKITLNAFFRHWFTPTAFRWSRRNQHSFNCI